MYLSMFSTYVFTKRYSIKIFEKIVLLITTRLKVGKRKGYTGFLNSTVFLKKGVVV